jgi:hypothetical protein
LFLTAEAGLSISGGTHAANELILESMVRLLLSSGRAFEARRADVTVERTALCMRRHYGGESQNSRLFGTCGVFSSHSVTRTGSSESFDARRPGTRRLMISVSVGSSISITRRSFADSIATRFTSLANSLAMLLLLKLRARWNFWQAQV